MHIAGFKYKEIADHMNIFDWNREKQNIFHLEKN